MNFYNDGENEKKEGAPALPRAASPFKKTSAFGKQPLFSRAAGGIIDRIKNLSRRDMALVGLGLSVLVMVPTAEYMMSQPQQDNLLSGGFGGPAPQGGNSPYEPGVNGLSQGSSDGSGEVITPLSSRDPVSLILGAQSAQPAAAAPVYTPPASSMRDAMRDAGREAFSAASKSAGAPTVIPRMAAGLRGMSSFFGGGESSRTQGSLGGGKIIDDARSASSKAATRSMVGPVAIAGYKGVAATPNSASKGAFEKLRAAADKSAGNFNGDSAIRSLDKASADALDIGKGAGGMGAGGDSDKTGKTSNNTTKGYEHNRSGESLEEKAARMRQDKALEWEFYKKYEIKKQIINAIVGAVSSVMGDFIKDKLMSAFDMYPPNTKCWNPSVCPDGLSCEAKAVTYLGANWWLPPNNKQLNALCSVAGSPVPYKVVVGKEAAASGNEVCICGKGEKPTSGGAPAAAGGGAANPGANPGESPSATPAHHASAAVAKMETYDAQLRAIVEMVAKAEADEKVDDKVVTGMVGAFQNLYPLADDLIKDKLGGLKDSAQKGLETFNSSLDGSSKKLREVKLKNDTFEAQWLVLDKACPAKDSCAVKLKAKEKVKSAGDDVSATADRQMDPQTAEAIRTALDQWKNTGRVYFSAASGNLTTMARWGSAYNQEVPKLVTALPVISQREGEIRSLVSSINGKGTPLARMKNLSGRLEKVAEPAAKPADAKETAPATGTTAAEEKPLAFSETPLYKTAVGQRGITWDDKTLWEKKHDFNGTPVSETEATEFGKWEAAVADPKAGLPSMPYQPENFLNFQMRATMLMRSMKVNEANFADINNNLDRTSKAIDAVRASLLSSGVDPSYFPGSETPALTPTNDNPEAPVNNGTPGVVNTGKNDPVAPFQRAYTELENRNSALPATYNDPRYAGVKANADKAMGEAKTALARVNAAQTALNADPTNAAKQKELADAKNDFNGKKAAASEYMDQASRISTGSLPLTAPVIKDEVDATNALHNLKIAAKCETYGVGTANKWALSCSNTVSGRISAKVLAAKANKSPFTAAKVASVYSNVDSACDDMYNNCRRGHEAYAKAGCDTLR